MAQAAVVIFVIFLILLLVRLFGAWMLRINSVIKHQKTMIDQNDQVIKGLKRIIERLPEGETGGNVAC